MASPRIEYAVLPAGEGPGQDRCFTADGLVVVLDGASAIDPAANPDATEYVDTLGPLLIEQITGTPGIDLRDALADAIRRTAQKLALVPGTAPSSTVSIVRWGEQTVDVLVLGDSPVIVQFANGRRKTIFQQMQDHIAPELRRRYRERLATGHGYDDEHRVILAAIQRQEAALRNQPAGYFIAEAEPDAANHADRASWQSETVNAVVVATDGVGTCEMDFTVGLTSRTLAGRLRDVYEWELLNDPEGAHRPRSKRHDDKTLAVIARVLPG